MLNSGPKIPPTPTTSSQETSTKKTKESLVPDKLLVKIASKSKRRVLSEGSDKRGFDPGRDRLSLSLSPETGIYSST